MRAPPAPWAHLPDDPASLLGLRPDIDAGFVALYRSVWQEGLDARLLELCRLRSAQILHADGPLHRRTPAAEEVGLTELDVGRLASWHLHDHFDRPTNAAIAFTEQYLLDPNGIHDTLARDLRDDLGEPGLVTFVVALAVFESYQRMCVLFDLRPAGSDHLCRAAGPHWSCPAV